MAALGRPAVCVTSDARFLRCEFCWRQRRLADYHADEFMKCRRCGSVHRDGIQEDERIMINEVSVQSLHDRATRGESLTDQEQAELQQWYTRLDHRESDVLSQVPPSRTVADLEAQVAAAVEQLQSVTQRIQKLSADNVEVRQEIVDLQRQLAQKSATQTA